MKSLSRLTRPLLLCLAALSCAPNSDPAHRPPSPGPDAHGVVSQGLQGDATYQSYWEAPGCNVFVSPSCATTSALIGRGAVGPEVNAPNTLHDSKCADGDDGLFHADGSVEALRISTLDGRTWLADNSTVKLEADVWGAPAGASTLMLFSAADAWNPQWVHLATLPTQGGPETLSHVFTLPTGNRVQAVRAALVESSQAQGQPCTPGAGNDHDDLFFRVETQDVSPPSVYPMNYWNGETVLGVVTLKAGANDNQAMGRVDFLINGIVVGSDTSEPYELDWDSASLPDGEVSYELKAWDAAGNHQSWSNTLTVRHDQAPPTVQLVSPQEASRLGGLATLTLDATDDVGIRRFEFIIDDTLVIGSEVSFHEGDTYSKTWDTREVASGPHTLKARVYDVAGKAATTQTVNFTVDHAPTVSLSAPTPGSTVAGNVVISADASDDVGVQGVSFYVNTSWVGRDTTPPYSITWQSTSFTNGTYTVKAVADDGLNSTTSVPVTVTVDNGKAPPSVTITSPASGATLQGLVTVTADAADASSGITQVDFFVGGGGYMSDTSAPYSIELDTRNLPNGPFTLQVRARNGASQVATTSIAVTIDNDRTPPTVALTSPADGATVRGTVTLTADASDARSGVTQVEFHVDSSQWNIDTSAPYAYSLDTRFLSNGSHTIQVRAKDGMGNLGISTPVTITVDNDKLPPTVAFTSPASGATLQDTVTLAVDASDAQSGVTRVEFYTGTTLVGVDTSAPYTYSLDTRTSPNGSLTLVAKARDGVGNVGSTSLTVTVDNDKVAPTVALTSHTNGATVQGTVTVTADASDARSGISKVEFYLGGVMCTDTSAPYSCDLVTRYLTNGPLTLLARATDGVGNVSTSSVTVTLDNDKTPPTVAFTSHADGATVQGTLTLTVDAQDARSGVSRVYIYQGGSSVAGGTSAPYTYTLNTRSLANGPISFSAKAWDGESNMSTASITLIVDNDQTPPTAAFTSPTNGATVQGTVTLAVDASDARSGVTKVEFFQGSTFIGNDTSAPYTLALNTASLANGTLTLTAKAWDGVGNVGTTSVTVTVDNDKTPPTVAFTAPANGATLEGTVTLTADASDARSGVTKVEFYTGTTLVGIDTSAPYTYTLDTRNHPNGSLTLVAKARDGQGNVGTASVNVTVDNDIAGPVTSITSPGNGATVSGTVQVLVSASDARSQVSRVEFYLGNTLLGTDSTAPFAWDLPTRNQANGSYNLTARSYDIHGNPGAATISVTFSNDFTPPTVSITSPANNAVLNAGTTYTLTASASDNAGVGRVEFYLNSILIGTDTTAPYSVTWTPSANHVGSHTLSAHAYDSAENRGTTGINFTVVNPSSPPSTPPAYGSFSYTATNTNSALSNAVTRGIVIAAGQKLTLGTCGITGASFSGDTYLRLYNASGTLVTSNDDACGGVGSNFVYTVPAGAGGTYQVHAGCYSNGSCSGTVVWALQ